MDDVQRYRLEAARLRLEASTVADLDTKRQMIEIADQYDGLAKSLEFLNTISNT